MTFDFSGYKPKETPEAAQLDEGGLFKGNKWIIRPKNTSRILRYRNFLKKVRDREGPEKARRYSRKMAQRDLYYLCQQILKFKDLYEPFHGDLCDFLQHCDSFGYSTLVETARGHFKSSIATTARATQWVLNNPNITIGLFSATLKSCRIFGKEIREQWADNSDLKSLFPEIFWAKTSEAKKWTEEAFSVRREAFIREETVTLYGLEETLPAGPHFRKILLDDVVNKENIGTPERIEKMNANAEMLNPLKVELSDPLHFVGTPYHLHDYYAKLERLASFRVYLRSALDENGEPAFPRFTKDQLEGLRRDHGNYLFNTQYLMMRQDPGDRRFDVSQIRYEEAILPGAKGMNFFICTDPASARRKDSDFTAILVFGYDWANRLHLVDGLHDKMNPLQRIDAWFRLAQKWKVMFASYETIGFQKTDAFFINTRMRETGYHVPIFEIPHHDVNKDERIMGFQPILGSGRFFMPLGGIPYERLWANPDDGYPRLIDVCEQLKREMEIYPMAPHDDLLDDCAQARSVLVAGHVPTPPPPPKPGPFELQTAYGRAVKKDDYNPLAH